MVAQHRLLQLLLVESLQQCQGLVALLTQRPDGLSVHRVRNAIRYTEPETQISIRLTESSHNAERLVMVEVNDAGPGIPEAKKAQIFLPFYRLDKARSSATGGFGVGLAITERAIKLHGATLRVLNGATGGTCIQMSFPAGVKANPLLL